LEIPSTSFVTVASSVSKTSSFDHVSCFCRLIVSRFFSLIIFLTCTFHTSTERTETIEGEEEPKTTELKHDKYFGEEVLGPGENTYAATVTSLSNTTCWKIDKMTVKRTLGKLRMKRRTSGTIA